MLKFKITSINRRETEDGTPLEQQVTCYGIQPEKPVVKEGEEQKPLTPAQQPFYGRATNSVVVLQLRDEFVQAAGLKVNDVLVLVKE